MFQIAVDLRVTIENLASKLKPRKAAPGLRITPTYDEFTAILKDIHAQKYNEEAENSGDYLDFLGSIGVGQAEASSIQKHHVNLTKSQLTIFRAFDNPLCSGCP